MARLARGEYLDPRTIQIVHTVQRCVRRAFLCGEDSISGRNYEHRRQWIRDRLEFLASVFAIDCLTYTVMSNHIHLILRSRPDIVRNWSDEQVARRWLRLYPKRRNKSGELAEPNQTELNQILLDPLRIAELRIRLSDISWWMRSTSENIARRANKEDDVTGHFWEGRFKAQPLLDESAILACAMYVDLNPVRAAMACTPEQSEFTGAKDRIDDLQNHRKQRKSKQPRRPGHWERCSKRRRKSGWMSPLQIDEQKDSVGSDACESGRRASLKGFLSMPLTSYLLLLDWTGRQLRSGKRGTIPKHLAPILKRLGIETKSWHRLISKFGVLFKRAAGTAESISKEASRRQQHWLHAPGVDCFS